MGQHFDMSDGGSARRPHASCALQPKRCLPQQPAETASPVWKKQPAATLLLCCPPQHCLPLSSQPSAGVPLPTDLLSSPPCQEILLQLRDQLLLLRALTRELLHLPLQLPHGCCAGLQLVAQTRDLCSQLPVARLQRRLVMVAPVNRHSGCRTPAGSAEDVIRAAHAEGRQAEPTRDPSSRGQHSAWSACTLHMLTAHCKGPLCDIKPQQFAHYQSVAGASSVMERPSPWYAASLCCPPASFCAD